MATFATLDVYQDETPRSAAMNMSVDEALWKSVKVPSLRLYRWDRSALSFGYFGRYTDVASFAGQMDLVRRSTGGGIVFHGNDLTYALVIPEADPFFVQSPLAIYAAVHDAIRNALKANGEEAELAQAEGGKVSESCFANPVRADVLVNGNKVAGAAQRRSRTALLQQGSIQQVLLATDFGQRLLSNLAENWHDRSLDASLLEDAQQIAGKKYGSPEWLRRR